MKSAKPKKPKLAVWKFTSCDGCQLTLLNSEDDLFDLLGEVDLAHFPEATSSRIKGPYDLSLVEGSISTPKEREHIKKVREISKYVVTMGACASAGGLQALRNYGADQDYASIVYPAPDHLNMLTLTTPVADHIQVDYAIPGCPVNSQLLLQVIRAILHGEPVPELPNKSVCVDCKKRGLPCVMTQQGRTCLGPLTQAGCGALCPSFNRACAGCYGPRKFAHPEALAKHWRQLGVPEGDIERAFKGICSYAEAYREEIEKTEKEAVTCESR